ncbi:MAG: hypothetical protein Kow0069_02080 [Promethearchaeota archaeon]
MAIGTKKVVLVALLLTLLQVNSVNAQEIDVCVSKNLEVSHGTYVDDDIVVYAKWDLFKGVSSMAYVQLRVLMENGTLVANSTTYEVEGVDVEREVTFNLRNSPLLANSDEITVRVVKIHHLDKANEPPVEYEKNSTSFFTLHKRNCTFSILDPSALQNLVVGQSVNWIFSFYQEDDPSRVVDSGVTLLTLEGEGGGGELANFTALTNHDGEVSFSFTLLFQPGEVNASLSLISHPTFRKVTFTFIVDLGFVSPQVSSVRAPQSPEYPPYPTETSWTRVEVLLDSPSFALDQMLTAWNFTASNLTQSGEFRLLNGTWITDIPIDWKCPSPILFHYSFLSPISKPLFGTRFLFVRKRLASLLFNQSIMGNETLVFRGMVYDDKTSVPVESPVQVSVKLVMGNAQVVLATNWTNWGRFSFNLSSSLLTLNGATGEALLNFTIESNYFEGHELVSIELDGLVGGGDDGFWMDAPVAWALAFVVSIAGVSTVSGFVYYLRRNKKISVDSLPVL